MTVALTKRLNQIIDRVTDKAFLSSEGIGNEIACYIFDYPADGELEVRAHIKTLLEQLKKHHKDLRVLHLDLFDVVIEYLSKRNLFDKALKMQETKGDAAVLKALRGPLSSEKIRSFIASNHDLKEHDLILLSGVGSVWPMLRAHGLLNCLHTVIGEVPLVMFYPGAFDGTTLKLFGRIATKTSKPGAKSYYRAFKLIPGETQS